MMIFVGPPFTKLLSLDAKNNTAFAISSGLPPAFERKAQGICRSAFR
jgi:hypothetical protein